MGLMGIMGLMGVPWSSSVHLGWRFDIDTESDAATDRDGEGGSGVGCWGGARCSAEPLDRGFGGAVASARRLTSCLRSLKASFPMTLE